MLKHRAHYLDAIAPAPSDLKRPDLRIANDHDAPVASPARTLQSEIDRVFAPGGRWSVRRTVTIGVMFHLGVFCALGMAAGAALTQFGQN